MQVDEGDGLDQDGHLSVAREAAVSIRKYVHVPLEAKAQCVADFCGASPSPSMRGSFAQQLAALIGVTFDGTTASAETWGRRERANEVKKLMASHRYKKLMVRPASRVFVSVSPSGVHSAVDELNIAYAYAMGHDRLEEDIGPPVDDDVSEQPDTPPYVARPLLGGLSPNTYILGAGAG